MKQLTVIDAADQQFGTILNNRRVTIRIRYNVLNDRWSMDLSVDDLPVFQGRRIVTGVDLLAQYNLGLGSIYALPVGPDVDPTRQALIDGTIGLYAA